MHKVKPHYFQYSVVSGFMPQQPQRRSIDDFEDVEARDPRLSGSQIRQAGHIAGRIASGVGAAAT